MFFSPLGWLMLLVFPLNSEWLGCKFDDLTCCNDIILTHMSETWMCFIYTPASLAHLMQFSDLLVLIAWMKTEWLLIWIQIISWLVTALLIVINGYLLLEFFSSEVNGAVFATIVCAFTAAYVAFVLYLISRAIPWQRFTQTKTTTITQNWVVNSQELVQLRT